MGLPDATTDDAVIVVGWVSLIEPLKAANARDAARNEACTNWDIS